MNDDITLRVVHTVDVDEDRAVEWIKANVLPGEIVEIDADQDFTTLLDGDVRDVDEDDLEKRIENTLKTVKL